MTKEERIWWAVLCLADEDIQRGSRREGDDCLASLNVSNIVRRKLRDEFKANLDNVFGEALDRYRALWQQETEKRIQEKKQWSEMAALIDEVKRLREADEKKQK